MNVSRQLDNPWSPQKRAAHPAPTEAIHAYTATRHLGAGKWIGMDINRIGELNIAGQCSAWRFAVALHLLWSAMQSLSAKPSTASMGKMSLREGPAKETRRSDKTAETWQNLWSMYKIVYMNCAKHRKALSQVWGEVLRGCSCQKRCHNLLSRCSHDRRDWATSRPWLKLEISSRSYK